MLTSFQTINIDDPQASRFQDNTEAAFRRVLPVAFLDGVLVKGIVLTAGADTKVSHGLGKTGASGWWPTRIRVGAFGAYETAGDANTVTLHATSTSTVDLWFYR